MITITISILERYFLFIGFLLFNTILPYSIRGIYLWSGTILAIIITLLKNKLTLRLLIISIGGLFHSAIHIYYPFLDYEKGYVADITAFPDVFFHSLMLIFIWLNIHNKISKKLQIITFFCILGSLVNCFFTNITNTNKKTYYYLFFNLTTSFQAISTAYWIAFCLHYGEWNKKSFVYGLFICNLVILSNWFWYNCDDIFELGIDLVKMSMKYKYIEGLFIVSTWIPLLFNNKQKMF